jgi:hypothetical protein
MIIPTAGTKVIEKNGFHKRIPARSYAVIMTETGGSQVKAIRLDKQVSMAEAVQTAIADNPHWKYKAVFPLTDGDFE